MTDWLLATTILLGAGNIIATLYLRDQMIQHLRIIRRIDNRSFENQLGLFRIWFSVNPTDFFAYRRQRRQHMFPQPDQVEAQLNTESTHSTEGN